MVPVTMKGIKGEVSLPLGGKREEALLGAWVRVPKDAVNMAQVNAQLTLRNPEHVMAEENDEDTAGIPPFVYLFREDDTFVYLPRHYSIKLLRNLPLRRLPYTSRKVNSFTTTFSARNQTQIDALKAFDGDADGILCLACGKGKAQPLDAKVMTPNGWVRMGDLEVGDYVIGSNGKPTEVLGVFDQGKKPVFRVTLSDGGTTEACGEHLWTVKTIDARTKGGAPVVLSTQQLLATGLKTKAGLRYSVEYSAPIEQDTKGYKLPMAPYLLGIFLGDGCSRSNKTLVLCNPEKDVTDKALALLPKTDTYRTSQSPDRCVAYVVKTDRSAGMPKGRSASYKQLELLGLDGLSSQEKFIPWGYLHMSSLEDRWELLRGLMDSDGYVDSDKGTNIDYLTTSERLKDDLVLLVQSLGGRVTWATKKTHYRKNGVKVPCSLGYRLTISFPAGGATPVSSAKHLAKWNPAKHRTSVRYIKSIEPVGDKECRCIRVDAEDSLYVTDDFILTHNTITSLLCAARGHKFPLLVIVHTTALLRQWRKEIMKVYGIKRSQIGHIQADKCDWKNKRVAIAMIHSLAQKKYPQEFYNHWRLVVADEIHTMAAYSFGPVAHRFTGQRMGLTATPERPDGMEMVFKIHFGKIRYEDKQQPLDSEFIFVHTGITIDSPAMKNPMKRIAKVMSTISRHEGRNAIVGKYLAAAKREGRRLIVLGDRTKTLEDLCDAFPGDDKALFIGRIKGEEERAAALEKRAIFASSKMAKEGLDVPSLDTLFITIPFRSEGRLEQSVGRILREYEGKHQPKTYIFVDNNSMMLRFAYGMKNWAERKGYKVTDVYPGKSWL